MPISGVRIIRGVSSYSLLVPLIHCTWPLHSFPFFFAAVLANTCCTAYGGLRWLVPGFRSPFLITRLKRLFAEQRGPSLVLDLVWCSQKYLNPRCIRKRCRVDPHSEDVVCRSEQWSVFVLQEGISYLWALTSNTEALLFHTEDELTGRRCGGHVSYENRHAVHSLWANSRSQPSYDLFDNTMWLVRAGLTCV